MAADGAERRWRVPWKVPVGKLAVVTLLVVVAGIQGASPWQWLAVAVVSAMFAGWAARDLAAPVRLAADPAGLTLLTGFARRHRLAWSQVEQITVDVRHRSRMLEVDAADRLYLFSRYDLDQELDEVVEQLEAIRTAAA